MSGYDAWAVRIDRDDRCQSQLRRERATRAVTQGPVTVEGIASRENLYCQFQERRRSGGHAPGPDDVSYADVSVTEVGEILNEFSSRISSDRYRPRETRTVPIPKPDGGNRILKIGSIFDRAVAGALLAAMEPLWERLFFPGSWGFRPQRGTWGMLADLERRMKAEDHWVLALEDVRGAFDNVQISHVLDAHRKLFKSDSVQAMLPAERQGRTRLLALIQKVLQGADSARTAGIDQGNPYSPLGLNAHLHFAHDAPMQAADGVRWWRYADDLTYLCSSMQEGRQVLRHARQLMTDAGLSLKGEGGVTDLSLGESVRVLGFMLRKEDDQLAFGVSKRARQQLRTRLDECHESADPSATARAAVLGWVRSAGPAFDEARLHVQDILRDAAALGFREIASAEELLRQWEDAWHAWDTVRKGTNKRPPSGTAARRENFDEPELVPEESRGAGSSDAPF